MNLHVLVTTRAVALMDLVCTRVPAQEAFTLDFVLDPLPLSVAVLVPRRLPATVVAPPQLETAPLMT